MMQQNMNTKIDSFAKQQTRYKTWQRVVSGLASVVVFVTTYALILPAITMKAESICDIPEHVHTDECFAPSDAAFSASLLCQESVHSHSPECYGPDGALICGVADFLLHSHSTLCYDSESNLVCQLPEIWQHTHSDACYAAAEEEAEVEQPHTHDDSCFTTPPGELICQSPELEGHAHGEGCFGEDSLTCTLPETEGHTHGEGCYGEKALSCTLEENEEHTHSDSCYTAPLICEQTEVQAHTHGDACYTAQLTCEIEEHEGHTHTDGCYEEISILTCELEEVAEPTETEETEASEPVLVCTVAELEVHTHTDGCYTGSSITCGKLQLTRHDHTDACLQTAEVETEGEPVLICELSEHTHNLVCYADPAADVETAQQWERNFAGITLEGDAAKDLLAVARTQVGYAESKKNYIVMEDGITIKGYTRYGAWAADAYADWSALFVNFCLHYAGISSSDFPRAKTPQEWIAVLKNADLYEQRGTPEAGDLIFLKQAEAYYAGIVTAVNEEGYVTAIIGDYKNEVSSETFAPGNADILGYGLLPDPQIEEPIEESTEATDTTEPIDATEATEDRILTADIQLQHMETQPRQSIATFARARTMAASNMTLAAAAEPSVAAAGGADLTPHITNVEINFKEGTWDGSWEKWDDSILVEDGYLIQFVIQYVLPAGTLSNGNNAVVYQLPVSQIAAARYGYVIDKTGSTVGEYTISASGLITITFFDEYVKENAAGVAIEGSISFDSTAEGLDVDGDNVIDMKFTDSEEVYIKIKDTVSTDLTVTKTGTKNNQDGTIDYTITVSSANGTDGNPVTLTDVMQNNTYYKNFKIVDRNSRDITSEFRIPDVGHGNFTLNLPAMNAGDTYTVTYTAKITSVPNGSTATASNGVSVKSETEDETILSDSDDVILEFEYDLLDKTSTYDSGTGMVHWTVTLDGSAFTNGISGWTLTDTFNGQPFTGTVTIKFANGSLLTNQSLPYTFPQGTTGIVTVTYDTPADYGLGSTGVSNTATLTPPTDTPLPPFSDTEDYRNPGDPSWEQYNPLDKSAGDMEVSQDRKTGQIQWTLTILSDKGAVAAPWTITDTLNSGQYYSPAQQAVIENEIQRILGNLYQLSGQALQSIYTLEFDREVYDSNDALLGYREFKLTVNRELAQSNVAMTMTYSSTAILEGADASTRFNNTADMNNKVTSVDGVTYQPVVTKMDADGSTSGDTTHAWMDLKDGSVSWKIQLYLPENLNAKVTMTEDLPDAIDLTELTMEMPNGTLYTFDFGTGDTASINARDYEITAVKQNIEGDKKVVIEIPTGFVNENSQRRIIFTVTGKLSEDFIFEMEADDKIPYAYTALNNSVYVKYGDNDEDLGGDDHTQYITDEDTTEYIEKLLGTVLNNVIPYTITINPNAEDLNVEDQTSLDDPAGKWLVVEDILSFWNYNYATAGKYTAALDTSDVFLTLYDQSGNLVLPKTSFEKLSGTVAEGSTFSYTQDSVEHWGTSLYESSTIVFRIPDEYKAVLDYQYKFSGQNTSSGVSISNIAKLQETSLQAESEHSQWIKITESDAEANLSSINIYKVDANNYANHLAGAHYELYKYDAETDEYHFDHIVISNGESELEVRDLEINVAYYLVEVQAPDGYILDESRHYFMIYDSTDVDDEGNVQTVQPDDFPASAYYPEGGVMYITNTRYGNSISVIKTWEDADGNTLTDTQIPEGTYITVQLMQVYSDYPLDFDYDTIGAPARVSIQVGNYSYMSNVYNSAYVGQVGDTIAITYRIRQTTADPAGLMRFTSTENIRIPYSTTVNGDGTTTYTFLYRVTGDAELHGWVYPENASGASVSVAETVDYTQAKITKSVTEYPGGLVTLSADGRWRYTFSNLPAYKLSSTGQVQGYYAYYFNEVASSLSGYVPTYSGAHSIGTATTNGSVTVTNAPPEMTQLQVTKEWKTTEGASFIPSETQIGFDLYQVTHTDPPGTNLHLADVVFEIGHWYGGGHEVLNKTVQVQAGSDMKLVLRTGASAPDITIDGIVAGYNSRTEVEGLSGYFDYVYLFRANGDVSLYGDVNSADSNVSASVTNLTEENRTQTQGTKLGSYTLTAANSWQTVISDLPVSEMTADGMVYYTYYVLETTEGYDVSYKLDGKTYSFCPDIKSGTLTMVNTPWQEDKFTELNVTKKWVDQDFKAVEPDVSSINFRLVQIATDSSNTSTEKEYKIYSLDASNNWTVKVKLPKENSDATLTYTYRVEEVTDGYTVLYQIEDGEISSVSSAVSSGNVTIYNQRYYTVLPNTGGTGTVLYTVVGLALCGWTTLQYNRKKGKKGDDSP